MTFLEYYFKSKSAAEKRPVIKEIINRCNVSKSTFYHWLSRKHAPQLEQEIISEITGIQKNLLYKSISINN